MMKYVNIFSQGKLFKQSDLNFVERNNYAHKMPNLLHFDPKLPRILHNRIYFNKFGALLRSTKDPFGASRLPLAPSQNL